MICSSLQHSDLAWSLVAYHGLLNDTTIIASSLCTTRSLVDIAYQPLLSFLYLSAGIKARLLLLNIQKKKFKCRVKERKLPKNSARQEAAPWRLEARPRLIAAATFDDLNNDCLVHILSFMETEEMNDATLVNSAFRDAQNAPSLDQTRKAIIICKSKETMTCEDLLGFVELKGWFDRVFQENSNKKILKIIGLNALQDCEPAVFRWVFHSVTCLDISSPSSDSTRPPLGVHWLSRAMPNLQEIDLSHTRSSVNNNEIGCFLRFCPNLCRIRWNGAPEALLFPPYLDARVSRQIMELYLNGSKLLADQHDSEVQRMFSHDGNECLWQHGFNLQRLDIQNATYCLEGGYTPYQAFSQEQLIKLVRNHPTLRWLKSDLTDENIAMLKKERPEVMLINE